jgi:hypothetical protein|tara:strand:+ start:1079 stop:1264 length:186 start_codon:yes stop_codon:yes gene_type:complete
MKEEYLDYWKTHKPSVVGVGKVHNWRSPYSLVLSSGGNRKLSLIWNLLPISLVWWFFKTNK